MLAAGFFWGNWSCTSFTQSFLSAGTGTIFRGKEPSWHRSARRSRTRARTLLRAASSGWIVPEPQRLATAVSRLRRHHSRSTLVVPAAMSGQQYWCQSCERPVKKSARFCPFCAAPQNHTYAATPTPAPWQNRQEDWSTWTPSRRTPSPRDRRPSSRHRGGQGKGKAAQQGKQDKGVGKGKKGEVALSLQPWTPPTLPPPPTTEHKVAPPSTSTSEDHRLAQQLREAFTAAGTVIPPSVAEILAKAEGDNAKLLTKGLHAHTAALGSARKQVQQARQAMAAQNGSWARFVQSALDSISKGAAEHEANIEKLKALEQDGLEKARAARASIRQLRATSVTELDDEESGEAELVVDAESMDTSAQEEAEQSAQVQKKLRMTEELAKRMPQEDAATPKRRVKHEYVEPSQAAVACDASNSG